MLLKTNMADSIYKDLGIKKSGLIVGDMRQELGQDLMRTIEKVISEKEHLSQYYMLIVAKNYGKDIKTTIMTMLQMPPKMLGSMCYSINNKRGTLKRLWILPLNFTMPEGLVDAGEPIKEIIESAKGMPIV